MQSQKLQIASSALHSVKAFVMRNSNNKNKRNDNSNTDCYYHQGGGTTGTSTGNNNNVLVQQQYPKVTVLKLILTILMMIVSISSIIEFHRIMKQYKQHVAATIAIQKQKQQQRKTIGTTGSTDIIDNIGNNVESHRHKNITMSMEVLVNQHVTDTLEDDQHSNTSTTGSTISSTVRNNLQFRHRRFEETKIEQFMEDHSDIVSSLSLTPPHQLHNSLSGQQQQQQQQQQHVGEGIAGSISIDDDTTSNGNDLDGTGSIVQYLQQSKLSYMISILKWNTSGILEQTSPINIPSWWNEQVGAHDYFIHTKPSMYGTVALFLNSDVLSAIPWNTVNIPPIPILLYTLPNTISNSSTCNLLSSIVKEARNNENGSTDNDNDNDDDQVTCLDPKPDDPTNIYKLLPNPYDRDKYNLYCLQLAEQTTNTVPWMERNSTIVWRGILHGNSDPSRRILVEMSANATINSQNHHWLDAVNVQEYPQSYLNFATISYYRYQLDIGGESGTTWGSLRWKMCSGNLVFKVDSWSYDWWHSTIIPWKHYIPVNSNLSNLYEQYIWAENNPQQVQTIIQQAVRTCKETIQTEIIRNYHQRIILDLPSATLLQMNEVNEILNNNLGNFYQPILERGE